MRNVLRHNKNNRRRVPQLECGFQRCFCRKANLFFDDQAGLQNAPPKTISDSPPEKVFATRMDRGVVECR